MSRRLTIFILCAATGTVLCLLFYHRGIQAAREQAASHSPASAARQQQPGIPRSALTPNPAETSGATSFGSLSNSSAAPASPVPSATPFLLGSAQAAPAMEPETVLGNMRIAVNQYGSRFGGNPVGTNPEITKALNGDNPNQVKFISEESGLRINGKGELVDSWGTAFFFHQLSGTEMEIHSAGPDKVMWTADDLVTR